MEKYGIRRKNVAALLIKSKLCMYIIVYTAAVRRATDIVLIYISRGSCALCRYYLDHFYKRIRVLIGISRTRK